MEGRPTTLVLMAREREGIDQSFHDMFSTWKARQMMFNADTVLRHARAKSKPASGRPHRRGIDETGSAQR
jgi:hypothetical protein